MPLFTGKIPVKRGVFIFKEMDLADLSPFEDLLAVKFDKGLFGVEDLLCFRLSQRGGENAEVIQNAVEIGAVHIAQSELFDPLCRFADLLSFENLFTVDDE